MYEGRKVKLPGMISIISEMLTSVCCISSKEEIDTIVLNKGGKQLMWNEVSFYSFLEITLVWFFLELSDIPKWIYFIVDSCHLHNLAY